MHIYFVFICAMYISCRVALLKSSICAFAHVHSSKMCNRVFFLRRFVSLLRSCVVGCQKIRSDAEKASGLQRLLKAYQEEIDALNKRCRASDSAFFSLYKSLYEAPDPAQALERSASEGPRVAASEVAECLACGSCAVDVGIVVVDV